MQPDFAVAASYKWLLGLYSASLRGSRWQGGTPLEEDWIQRANASDFASLTLYTDIYEAGARRFDMGERSNFALLPAALRAMYEESFFADKRSRKLRRATCVGQLMTDRQVTHNPSRASSARIGCEMA